MPEKPDEALLRCEIDRSLDENMARLEKIMKPALNTDVVLRSFEICTRRACLIFVDGMAGRDTIDRFVLEPCMNAKEMPENSEDVPRWLSENVLGIDSVNLIGLTKEVIAAVLDGKSVLLIDGVREGIELETRAYEKRSVGRTENESVVQGPQEAFVEAIKTNVALIRRLVRSELLRSESLLVGTQLPTQVRLIYLDGVAKKATVDLVRERIRSLRVAQCMGTGYLQQLIEDHPYSPFPQMLQTERPDRAAAALTDGQIVLLVDGAPYALIAPVSFFQLINASDDTFMRWQYGTFVRVVRVIGLFVSLLLPGLYVAITLFHAHMLPLNLLTSIAETRARVPFSVLVEVLFMELSFYLLNEAGTRIPSQLGSALGIVGALILGQAAVEASIISPILIIVVSLTGLGNYAIPNYGVSVGMQMLRLCFVSAAGFLGLYGMLLLLVLLTAYLGWMTSFGEAYLAPLAPYRPHNGDVGVRLPLFMQTRDLFTAVRGSWMSRGKDMRGWKKE